MYIINLDQYLSFALTSHGRRFQSTTQPNFQLVWNLIIWYLPNSCSGRVCFVNLWEKGREYRVNWTAVLVLQRSSLGGREKIGPNLKLRAYSVQYVEQTWRDAAVQKTCNFALCHNGLQIYADGIAGPLTCKLFIVSVGPTYLFASDTRPHTPHGTPRGPAPI